MAITTIERMSLMLKGWVIVQPVNILQDTGRTYTQLTDLIIYYHPLNSEINLQEIL